MMWPVSTFLLSIIFVTGCAQVKAGYSQARDYVGVHHGKVNVGLRQNFGQGLDKKNYYVINKDNIIAVGDSKEEVIKNAGYADKIERSIDGYEVWVYNQKKIKLFFDKEHLKEWSVL